LNNARTRLRGARRSLSRKPNRCSTIRRLTAPQPLPNQLPLMFDSNRPILIATRGSALALAQANMIAAQCRAAFPRLRFELKIIKTTGDKLQKVSLAQAPEGGLPKGLFTKELEIALVKGQADLAVHSLKDLPTDLPAGLTLAATPKRADVRDVLIYRDAEFIKARAVDKASKDC